MSDFMTGYITASVVNSAQQRENTDYTIAIGMCNAMDTKAEVRQCLVELQKKKEASDNDLVVVGWILVVIFIIFLVYIWWINR